MECFALSIIKEGPRRIVARKVDLETGAKKLLRQFKSAGQVLSWLEAEGLRQPYADLQIQGFAKATASA